MTLSEQIQKDITAAMKARDELRLSTLRMVKSALHNRQVEKMAALDDKEALQVLSTLIKQRKDSIEQFTKGGRKELADKEAAEIVIIEGYMPKALGEAEIAAAVRAAIATWSSANSRPSNFHHGDTEGWRKLGPLIFLPVSGQPHHAAHGTQDWREEPMLLVKVASQEPVPPVVRDIFLLIELRPDGGVNVVP
jgi:uncharacterized protein YqeY